CCSPRATRRRSCAKRWPRTWPTASCGNWRGSRAVSGSRLGGAPRSTAAVDTATLKALPELGPPAVLLLRSIDRVSLALLLTRFSLELTLVGHGEEIPGSYW